MLTVIGCARWAQPALRLPPSVRWLRCALDGVLAAALVVTVGGPAAAQAPQVQGTWTSGTTLNLFGGVGADDEWTSGAAGAAFGWEVTPRFSIEAGGSWLKRGPGAQAFAADMTVLFHPKPASRFAPFLKGGIGLYDAQFDVSRSPIPDFYRARLDETNPLSQSATFTDPALVAGGGVTIWVSRHVSLRPEVDLKIVIDSWNAHLVSIAAVRFAYHFQEHPVENRTH